MVCPNYSRSCKNTTCGPGPSEWPAPPVPVTIRMFSQPLLSKFLCVTNLMIYSAERIPRETKCKACDYFFLSAELLEYFHLKKNILKYLNAWLAFLVDC